MTDVASVVTAAAQEPLVVVGVVELVGVGLVVVVVGAVLELLLSFGLLELVVGVVVVPVVGEVLALLELLLAPPEPELVVVGCCELPLLPLGSVDVSLGWVEVPLG